MFYRMMLIAAVLTSTAFADDTEDRSIQYRQVTEITFENMDIEGTVVKPNVQLLTDVRRAQFAPMIELRTNFTPEIRVSTQEIR